MYAAAAEMVDAKMLDTFEEGDFDLPRKSNLVRMVNRNRQKLRPEEPTGLDFEVNLDYIKEDFLIGDVKLEDARHLIFGTATTLGILQRVHRWYMDGTFRIVASPFVQLYTIHAFVRQGEILKQVPLVFILMSKRRTRDYTAVLEKILHSLNEAPLVQGFMMDYEMGLWQALRGLFPGRQMKGCAFHWGQALYKKVKNVGLQTTYQRREAAAHIIRKLLGLPFLPVGDIPRAFERLREKVEGSSSQMLELFEYVESTWLRSSVWGIDNWNVYKQAVRTNNDVEGWHNRVNRRARNSNLPFYVLITLLFKEAKLVPLTVQGVSEGTVSRDRRLRAVEMDVKLHNLWEKYDSRDIVTEDFLKQVGEIYSGQFSV